MTDLKVAFLTACDVTTPNGYRTRVLSEIDQLSRRGVTVSVISVLHIRYWLNVAGLVGFARRLREHGCDLLIVPAIPDNQWQSFYKLADMYQSWVIRKYLLRRNISVLHCHATHAAYLGVTAAADLDVSVIYDMHGASLAEVEEAWPEDSAAYMRTQETERVASLGSTVVISVSRRLADYWRERYPDAPAKQTVVPCAVDTHVFRAIERERENLRSRWSLGSNAPVFAYLGSAAEYQMVGASVDLFNRLSAVFDCARMLVISPPKDILKIKGIVDRLGVSVGRIAYHSVDRNMVATYLSACDFGFLLRDDKLLNQVAFPTKFGEYLSCGVPVITSPYVWDIRAAIEEHGVGFIYNGDLADAIGFVREVMRNRRIWATKTREFAINQLSWPQYGRLLKGVYSTAIQEQGDKFSGAR